MSRFFASLPLLSIVAFAACGSDEGGVAGQGANGGGAGKDGSAGGGTGGGIAIDAGDGGLDPDAACAAKSAQANLVSRPIDIIFLVDTSSTMNPVIDAVVANIDVNFAAIIAASGIDYRVIVVAKHGSPSNYGACFKSPLSLTNCSPVPAAPANNPPKFFHYDPGTHLGSSNTYPATISGYNVPDAYGLAPSGWSEWVRAEAFKTIVVMTDGTSEGGSPLDGAGFDAALLGLSPAKFGTAAKRDYIAHAFVGISENNPPTQPYAASDGVISGTCSSLSVSPGFIYQDLAILTGGLRFPLCQYGAFDQIFNVIAQGVIEGAKIECEFEMPDAPPGETLDPSTIIMKFTPGGGAPYPFNQVANAAACAPNSFYIEQDVIRLCPETCTAAQADPQAALDILFGCKTYVF
jgi:hypothetical protein